MIESEAYKTYYAYATGEKTPTLEYVQKKANSKTSPKKKPVQASKGKRLKVTAKKYSDEDDDDEDTVDANYDDEDTVDDNDDDQKDDVEDDDDEQTESDNDGNDFVHPKFFTHDEEERQDE
nr:hypothetical protein [Tanacetum cinerariifolium]